MAIYQITYVTTADPNTGKTAYVEADTVSEAETKLITDTSDAQTGTVHKIDNAKVLV